MGRHGRLLAQSTRYDKVHAMLAQLQGVTHRLTAGWRVTFRNAWGAAVREAPEHHPRLPLEVIQRVARDEIPVVALAFMLKSAAVRARMGH